MTKKSPDLCQYPYCSRKFTKTVRGRNRLRIWSKRVCDEHAIFYERVLDRAYNDHTRLPLTVTPRQI